MDDIAPLATRLRELECATVAQVFVAKTAAEQLEAQADTIRTLREALKECMSYVAKYESENESNVALAVYDRARVALAFAEIG